MISLVENINMRKLKYNIANIYLQLALTALRMQGQHFDEESGLHYNRHRYYDPTLGRYITQDPIGLLGGWNLYAYPQSPLQQTAPLELAS
jgi:RHS repeat-associated protein